MKSSLFLFCVVNICGMSEYILFFLKMVFGGSVLLAQTYSLIKEMAVICRNDCFFFFSCWIIALCIHCENVHIDQWQSLADALTIIWNLSKFCIWYTQSKAFVQVGSHTGMWIAANTMSRFLMENKWNY